MRKDQDIVIIMPLDSKRYFYFNCFCCCCCFVLFPLAETCKVYAPELKIRWSDNIQPQIIITIKKAAREARFTDARIENKRVSKYSLGW